MHLTIGDTAPDSIVFDIDGEQRHLSDYWANGAVLLTFLRHFG